MSCVRPRLLFLDRRAGVHGDAPVAFAVGVLHVLAVLADERDPGGGEIGALDDLENVVERRLGVVEQEGDRVEELLEVMRGDVRGHADRDSGGAVEQQVREPGRQDRGLLITAVVVGLEIDRVLVDVGDELLSDGREPRLRIAHRGRRVAVDAPEVPLPIHERVAHGEVLRHAHHGFVHGTVAVGMVAAHHIAHDAGGLAVSGARTCTTIEHAPNDAPLDRLEAVADIRQGARNDHAHRVIEIARAHLLLDADRANGGGLVHGHTGVSGKGRRRNR